MARSKSRRTISWHDRTIESECSLQTASLFPAFFLSNVAFHVMLFRLCFTCTPRRSIFFVFFPSYSYISRSIGEKRRLTLKLPALRPAIVLRFLYFNVTLIREEGRIYDFLRRHKSYWLKNHADENFFVLQGYSLISEKYK